MMIKLCCLFISTRASSSMARHRAPGGALDWIYYRAYENY